MATIRFISGEAALANFIEGIRAESVRRMAALGRNATKRLSNSLKTEVVKIGTGSTQAELSGLNHWAFLGNGRRPGKKPPVDPLIEWVKAKGLASEDKEVKKIAYIIQRKIAEEGTLDHQLGGANMFSQIIIENQPQVEEVVSAFLQDYREPIARQFRTAFAS